MQDPRIEKLADVLINYSLGVRPGDKVLIQGETPGEALLRALYVKTLQAGGHPMLMPVFPGNDVDFMRYASTEQIEHIPEPSKLIVETFDCTLWVSAARNTKALSNVDPQQQVIKQRAEASLFKTYMERAARGELRWSTTLFPTDAFAQDAEMALDEYADFVFGACLPDPNDPVGYWKRQSAEQQRIIDWLAGKERVHVLAPGTDLHLSIAGRSFINSNGAYNMPDGEIYTGPVENSVEGHVTFSYPAIHAGREVSGVQLEFQEGKVIKATASKNQTFC